MTLRVIGYDGTEYRAQMNSGKGPYYPVVTLVLNFDTRKPWNAPKSLYETFSIPDILKPYVQDYKINVFDIAFLTPDQVKLFKSDFRIVADYFVQKRIYGDYNPSPEDIEHMSAVLQLLSVMADDNRFVEVMNEAKKGDMKNMCDVLDRIEARGVAKGVAEAREEVVVEMLTEGEPIKKIEKYSKLSESEIREIAAKLNLTVNEG